MVTVRRQKLQWLGYVTQRARNLVDDIMVKQSQETEAEYGQGRPWVGDIDVWTNEAQVKCLREAIKMVNSSWCPHGHKATGMT